MLNWFSIFLGEEHHVLIFFFSRLAVTEETVSGLLDDMTLAEALEKNKMFICDLEITDGLPHKDTAEVSYVESQSS